MTLSDIIQWIVVAAVVVAAVVYFVRRGRRCDSCCDCPDKNCPRRRR